MCIKKRVISLIFISCNYQQFLMCLFILALLERTFPHFGQVASPVWVFMWWLKEDLNLNVLGHMVQGKPSPSNMPSSPWYSDKFQNWPWPGKSFFLINQIMNNFVNDRTHVFQLTLINRLNGWEISIKGCFLVDWVQIHIHLVHPCQMPF